MIFGPFWPQLFLEAWKMIKANLAQLNLYPNPTKMAAELITRIESHFKNSVEVIVLGYYYLKSIMCWIQ